MSHREIPSVLRAEGRLLKTGTLRILAVAVVVGVLALGCTDGSETPKRAGGTSASPGRRVRVPNLLGLDREDAESRLDQLGIDYRVSVAGPPLDDRVVGQRPRPGRFISGFETLTLAVRCAPLPCPSPEPGEVIYDPCSCKAH